MRRGRRFGSVLTAFAVALGATIAVTSGGGGGTTCDRNATTATFSAQFAALTSGQVLCLATGDYTAQSMSAAKAGMVTIRPQESAAPVVSPNLTSGASNITFDDLEVEAMDVASSVHDITVRNSEFTGFAYIDSTGMSNDDILFENNTHVDINMPSLVQAPGRVHVDGASSVPSGIVIRGSLFSGGTADGVRADGGASIVIEDNEFTAINDVDPYHADPIQFYEGAGVTVRGNYFHDQQASASCSVGSFDGGSDHLIEDNVVVGSDDCFFGMYLMQDSDSIVRHNTFVFGDCAEGIDCGEIVINGKTGGGSGTLYRDNIFTRFSNGGSFPSTFSADHNLTRDVIAGTANVVGTPVFVGGATPTSYAGFKLADGSPGEGTASDDLDRGARIP